MDPLFSVYNFTGTEFSATIIAFNIVFSFILQLAIVWVYRKTHRGLSYSESFLFTLVMIGVLGTVVMMVIRNNLVGAFALLGAFSLIRFRTIVKETRDVAFVFFALAVGVAVGTNNYSIAIIASVLLSAMIVLMWRYKFGISSHREEGGFVLTIASDRSLALSKIKEDLERNALDIELLHSKKHGEENHYAFSLYISDTSKVASVEKSIRGFPGVKSVELITTKHSVEY
jgi:uncharacterized membrane protein YhiD involved in acid resistance